MENREKRNERQRRFIAKKKASGEIRKTLWVKPENIDFFNILFADDWRIFNFLQRKYSREEEK